MCGLISIREFQVDKLILKCQKSESISTTKELDIPGKVIHPSSHLSGQVNGRGDTFLDDYFPPPFNEVIRMGDDLLFGGMRHAVTREQPEKGAFIGSESCTGMAFHNPGNILADPVGTKVVCSLLGMQDRMGCSPADIMEHRTFGHQINPDEVITRSISECNILYSPAMSDHLLIAPSLTQQVFPEFIRPAWHDPGIF
jgi:hypothetical protein